MRAALPAVVGMLAVVALLVSGCSSSTYAPYGYGGAPSEPGPSYVGTAPATTVIVIRDARAEPATVTVRAGATVGFNNAGKLNTTLRLDSPSLDTTAPAGGVLSPGGSLDVPFPNPGVYRFGGDMQTQLVGMPSGQLGLVLVLAKPGPTVFIVPVAKPRSFMFASDFSSVRLVDPLIWVNADAVSHELYIDGKWKGSLGPGETYPMTFAKAGLHTYSSPSTSAPRGLESGRIFVNP